MRLIDADSLYYKVKCECNPYGKPTIDFESGKKVLDWIDNAPPVEPCYQTTSCLDCKMYDKENHHCPRFCEVIKDMVNEVEERPKGEWIPTVIDTGLFERSVCREWKCSNCGEVVNIKYPFCHCGADMREQTNNVKPCSSCAHFNNGNRKLYPCGSCFINSHNMWEAEK